MHVRFLSFFLSLPLFIFCVPPPIVFIHIGKKIPHYSEDAIRQAKFFNPDSNIYFLLNQQAYLDAPYSIEEAGASAVFLEKLPISNHHKKFRSNKLLDSEYQDGFWTYTSERFFYLDSFMGENNLTNVFHLEYDNMLYKNLSEIIPVIEKNYPGCAATFGFDKIVVPGCIYFADHKASSDLVKFFSNYAHKGWIDMTVLGKYWAINPNKMAHLPTIPPLYPKFFPLENLNQETSRFEDLYSSHFYKFKGIFDAAAIGQYLGGQNPANGLCFQGYKNPVSLMNLENCQFEWGEDSTQKKIPIMIINGARIPIYSLHIHSKNLVAFRSDLDLRISFNFRLPSQDAACLDSLNLLSGQIFQSMCDFCFDGENSEFFSDKVMFGNKIFVKTDLLKFFIRKIHPMIKNPYVLVTHNSDLSITKTFSSFLNEPKLLRWFGVNIFFKHPKLCPIPSGIASQNRPYGNISIWSKKMGLPQSKRVFKIYMNFNPQTHPVRGELLKMFENNPLFYRSEKKELEDYIEDLKSFQFVLCPRGVSLDCHRIWEALYMGAIPIVLTSQLDPLLEGLPVIILDRWEDLTYDNLIRAYEHIQNKPQNKNKLFASHWYHLLNLYKSNQP